MKDEEILKMIRENPADWRPQWELLWLSYREAVTSAMRKWLREDTILDVLFDESLLIFRKSVLNKTFREDSSIKTYLVSICYNLNRNEVRKKNKTYAKEPSEMQQIMDTKDIHEADAVEGILSQEKSEILERLIAKTKKDCRKLLIEFYWENMSQKEMADNRGFKGVSTIKNKLAKCRKELEELIRGDQQGREVLDFLFNKKAKREEEGKNRKR